MPPNRCWLWSSLLVASVRDGTFPWEDCSYGAVICSPDTRSREVDVECGDTVLVGSGRHWHKRDCQWRCQTQRVLQ